MTAALPVGEPPADDVADLLDLIEQARINARHAGEALERLTAVSPIAERLPAAQMYYDVDRTVAAYRASLWQLVVDQLETTARAMGLQP